MERIDWTAVDRMVEWALEEDLGAGDITTRATVSSRAWGSGQIVAKQSCVAVGLFLVEGERTILNFLQRLCGTATLTSRFVRAVAGGRARIYDTRKTTPGLRTLEKYAVRAAGGCNHRMGLYDAFLIKENHVAAAGGVDKAVLKARKAAPEAEVEIEVRNMEELVLAVEYGADVVLLDNMEPRDVRKAARLVGRQVQLEVSGGINLRTAKLYADSGVHRISVGALTHSAPATDLSMLIVKQRARK